MWWVLPLCQNLASIQPRMSCCVVSELTPTASVAKQAAASQAVRRRLSTVIAVRVGKTQAQYGAEIDGLVLLPGCPIQFRAQGCQSWNALFL
jgi:hypothetical protein